MPDWKSHTPRWSYAVIEIGVLLSGIVCSSLGRSATPEDSLWDLLRSGGHIALMRHASAPGIGDPADFTLGDCSTQRNLSAEGREQARQIGKRFRKHRITEAAVFSSQWCRCLETARLLGFGPVEKLPLLNSFFARPDQGKEQTRRLQQWITTRDPSRVTVLVTHQVNITALTGVFPASGEMVVVRRSDKNGITVVGTLKPR